MSTLLPNALSETLSSSCILGCASKRKVSAPEEDRPRNATAVETNSIADWTTGDIAGPLPKMTLAEAGKFTKEATAKTEEAVAKTAVAFSATAELINTTMRASAKAAAAMLIRLSRSNNERAVAVLTHLIDTNKTNTKAMHEKTTRTAKLFEEVIKLHVQAAADLVIALMGRSAQSSEALMCTLVENSPTSAYQLLTVIISRGDTHAQQLFVYILRDRAANGMPLLTKMLPHFVPLLRKELCVRLKQKNVDGGIPLGPSPKRPLYHLRWVHTRRPKTRTEFGRRLQAETIPHDKLLPNLGVELRMTTETADAPALPALPLMELEYQPLHDDLLPPLPLPEPTSAPGSAHGSAPALAPHETVPAVVRQPSAADFDGLGVVVFDLNLRVVGTVGEEVGIALVGVGPLPNLFGQIRSFSGECNKLRVWWNLNEKTVRLHVPLLSQPLINQPATLYPGAHCLLRAADARAH